MIKLNTLKTLCLTLLAALFLVTACSKPFAEDYNGTWIGIEAVDGRPVLMEYMITPGNRDESYAVRVVKHTLEPAVDGTVLTWKHSLPRYYHAVFDQRTGAVSSKDIGTMYYDLYHIELKNGDMIMQKSDRLKRQALKREVADAMLKLYPKLAYIED